MLSFGDVGLKAYLVYVCLWENIPLLKSARVLRASCQWNKCGCCWEFHSNDDILRLLESDEPRMLPNRHSNFLQLQPVGYNTLKQYRNWPQAPNWSYCRTHQSAIRLFSYYVIDPRKCKPCFISKNNCPPVLSVQNNVSPDLCSVIAMAARHFNPTYGWRLCQLLFIKRFCTL